MFIAVREACQCGVSERKILEKIKYNLKLCMVVIIPRSVVPLMNL